MKKILVLTPRYPYPVIGGDRLRIYEICKELSKYYSLTLLSLCETQTEVDSELPQDAIFDEIHKVLLPKWRSRLNTLFALPTNKPLQIAYYSSKKFKDKLDELSRSHDATLSHLIRVGDYAKDLNCCINFIELTDAISLNYKRVREVNNGFNIRSMIYSIEQKRLEQYERNVIDSFSLCSLVSKVDADFLYGDRNDCENVLVASNGVDFTYFPFKHRSIARRGPVEIAFIGNMHSLQNFDAARWFIESVLPALNSTGNFTFKVIGRITERDMQTLSKYKNVIVTGAVDSVVDATSDSSLAVCPMRLGAGVQNKVLEYMALGLPCVTSTIGFEGIGAVNGSHLLVADSVEEYCQYIYKLVDSITLYERLASNGRRFVEDKFSWESKLEPLVSAIRNIV